MIVAISIVALSLSLAPTLLATYRRVGTSDRDSATIDIATIKDSNLYVRGFTTHALSGVPGSVSVGGFMAIVTVRGRSIHLTQADTADIYERCVIDIAFSPDYTKAEVSDTSCIWGLNAGFAGNYVKEVLSEDAQQRLVEKYGPCFGIPEGQCRE